MLNIEQKANYRISFHHLGFRPFFLLGSLFAVVAMGIWFLQYHFNLLPVQISNLPVVFWHGHEMIFGYGVAVIAGFLLTAVRNWTGVQTLHGWPLLMLALLWLVARLLPFSGSSYAMTLMVVFDLGFNALLCLAILYPIVKVKQWSQLGVWLTLGLVCLANLLFYLGLLGQISSGMDKGLYAGLYLILSLIMLMGRRVIPFFIEKGVDEQAELRNYLWLDIASIILVLLFIAVQVFSTKPGLAALLATALFLLHSLRLAGWHTPGIWQKPLLWILYIAYGSIVLGFGLTALGNLGYINPKLATHTFAYGGVGLMTLGMMARVAYGHTGRDVFAPPPMLRWVFLLAVLGLLVRVALPVLLPAFYSLWVGLSQGLWILAFAAFSWAYGPLLVKPRVDGRYG